jgi:ribosomal-protein-alanine N-acetyltransferase
MRIRVDRPTALHTELFESVEIAGVVNHCQRLPARSLRRNRIDDESRAAHSFFDRSETVRALDVSLTCEVSVEDVVRQVDDLHPHTLPHVTATSYGVRTKGTWPQPVLLTHGWGRALARPWNDDVAAATVRLERGGVKFLADVTSVVGQWSKPVLSPAVLPHRVGLWRQAGYEVAESLLLFEHDLRHLSRPQIEVERTNGLEDLNLLDREAFPPRWRMGRAGLRESLEATPRHIVYKVCDEGGLAGFAIAGIGLGIAYLQRLAVAPRVEGRGVGRSLVAASLLWARRHGAGSLLVNTQRTNARAAALYERCGFRKVSGGLAVLAAFGTDF